MSFRKELRDLINKCSMENGSNTPDFILAEYLVDCLESFDKVTNARETWYYKKYGINSMMEEVNASKDITKNG